MNQKITCKNPRCKHTWIYKGNSKFYVTCPMCYNKVKIEQQQQETRFFREKE